MDRGQGNLDDFGQCAARLDGAESVGGERIGGPNVADVDAAQGAERRLAHLQPETAEDWRWLARRMARALENDWNAEASAALIVAARPDRGGST